MVLQIIFFIVSCIWLKKELIQIMPKIYSEDLREKVINFYIQSKHKSNTCKTFNIARSTLDGWILLIEETGKLKQPKSDRYGRPAAVKDMCEFKKFIETTPFKKIKELVPLFEKRFGYGISYAVLRKTIHRAGLSRERHL